MSDLPIVLIVDDEPTILFLCEAILKSEFQVITTSSVQEALQEASAKPIAMALSDIFMPDTDGFEFLEAMKKSFPQVPVILMTAHTTSELEQKSLAMGASAFLSKPLNKEALIEKCRHVVGIEPLV